MFTYETIHKSLPGAEENLQTHITGFEGEVNFLKVPSAIEGMTVTGIAARAFADRKDVQEVQLPETVTMLGGFAFHNCTALRKLTLHNTVTNYSDGFIKGCRALTEVTMLVDAPKEGASFEAVKRLLADTDVVIRFRFVYEEGKASEVALLTFPDYLNEAQEDTRARAIHQTIEGAGYAYRECVRRGEIDYAGYDALFDRVRQIAPVTAEDIAMNRLMTPYRLYEAARKMYADFLTQRTEAMLQRLIKAQDTEGIRFLAGAHLLDFSLLDAPIEAASKAGQAQVVALLMNYR